MSSVLLHSIAEQKQQRSGRASASVRPAATAALGQSDADIAAALGRKLDSVDFRLSLFFSFIL